MGMHRPRRLTCCCAAVTACTVAAPKGPNANVTVPSVGKPPAPASAQAALSSEAFTPYASLGAASDDGLAPGETYQALHTACMNDAGYGHTPPTRRSTSGPSGLGFPHPARPWGYIGVSLAQQYGFVTPGSGPAPGGGVDTFAPCRRRCRCGDKCFNIIADFNDHEFSTSLAGIETMNNEISTDVIQDAEFKNATPPGRNAWLRTATPPSPLRSRGRRSKVRRPPGPGEDQAPPRPRRQPRRPRPRSRWP